MLATPFPFIANNMGWNTAELGRQPWLVYGLMRTAEGSSLNVSSGNALFVLLGFMGMYALFGLLYLFLVLREVEHGPGRSRSTAGQAGAADGDFWFAAIARMLAVYVVLDGFDLGAGVAQLVVARRRASAAASSRRSARSGTATRCG